MPAALCLPPAILDHTFPADLRTLQRVGRALGNLQKDAAAKRCYLLMTPAMEEFVVNFEWADVASYPLLQVVYQLLVQWLLQPTPEVRMIDTTSVVAFELHPVPVGSGGGLLIDLWQEQVGKLFTLCSSSPKAAACVGVACDFAYAGGPLGSYVEPASARRFPLVGPAEFRALDNLDVWVIPADFHTRHVSYGDAERNLKVLGGKISDIAVGSHYKVTFPDGRRSWTLDSNFDRVPDRFIDELGPILDLPVDVIRYVLIFGEYPERKCCI